MERKLEETPKAWGEHMNSTVWGRNLRGAKQPCKTQRHHTSPLQDTEAKILTTLQKIDFNK